MNILDKTDKSSVGEFGRTDASSVKDKIARYEWVKPTTPGVFRLIDKDELNIDGNYQREAISSNAVMRIAREWNWVLFGVLKVAVRPDQTYWVFDGGHRARASFYRSDITKLPCMVYQIEDMSEEARSFIAGAKLPNRISAVDTFRASIVANDAIAVKADNILKLMGLDVAKTAKHGGQIKCIGAIQYAISVDEQLAKTCLQLCKRMAGDSPISSHVFGGLFVLCRRFKDIEIPAKYASELDMLTQPEVERSIRATKAELGIGGDQAGAKAILKLLNKNKKTKKLVW